jgi:glycosyltransferase involved in cell wall biosynthesis
MQQDALLPLVTIIIPTIGRPAFIVDTVRSVLAQDYRRLQILISDNAPSTPTAPLLAAAGVHDDRIETVTRSQRLGFSAHMNACIAQAKGTYFMILSDDDQITPGYVSEMVGLMQGHAGVTLCLGRQVRTTENDLGLLATMSPSAAQIVMSGSEFLGGTLSGSLQTQVLTYISLFARVADVVQCGGFKDYPDGSHADNFIVFSLALAGDVALGSNLMFYRVYLGSFGLRTPFPALLEATRRYTHDCAQALRWKTSVRSDTRSEILQSLHRNNSRLLLSRIRHVYARSLSPNKLLWCLLQAVRFRMDRKIVL